MQQVIIIALLSLFAETDNTKKLARVGMVLDNLVSRPESGHTILAYTKNNRPVTVYFFPGTSKENALVIGGVHGSELSSVEITRELISQLSDEGKPPYYNVLIVPGLFPDNIAKGRASVHDIGSHKNIGRYTDKTSVDPNRQMPPPGKPFERTNPVDLAGRPIEFENALLLEIIQHFRPAGIVSVHAIRSKSQAGIYADPRTDCNSVSLGYSGDSLLAITMAKHIDKLGAEVPGNKLAGVPTTIYYKDPQNITAGFIQPRSFRLMRANASKDYGVSLGTWAATTVCDHRGNRIRKASRVITVEFPGSKRPEDYTQQDEQEKCRKAIVAYASAIRHVFLHNEPAWNKN